MVLISTNIRYLKFKQENAKNNFLMNKNQTITFFSQRLYNLKRNLRRRFETLTIFSLI